MHPALIPGVHWYHYWRDFPTNSRSSIDDLLFVILGAAELAASCIIINYGRNAAVAACVPLRPKATGRFVALVPCGDSNLATRFAHMHKFAFAKSKIWTLT